MSDIDEILDKLADHRLGEIATSLALGALLGDEELQAALAGEASDRPARDDVPSGAPVGAYLSSLSVRGFRGIGPEARIDLTPGPGLTIVVGRNGSGKSSFSEALEVLLTGESYRWKKRAKVWKDGWRNLHADEPPRVLARFAADGLPGEMVVERTWEAGEKDADAAATVVQLPGRKRTDLAGIGWTGAVVEGFRPLLSYRELGIIGDNPSDLFDALTNVLGLDVVESASDLLRAARRDREQVEKQVRTQLKDDLLPALRASDDERAAAAVEALEGRNWDLATVEHLAAGRDPTNELLGQLARLEPPAAAEVARVAAELEAAITKAERLGASDSGRARALADLLRKAVDHHDRHGDGPCPICGAGHLDSRWRSDVDSHIRRLEGEAGSYDAEKSRLRGAVDAARRLCTVPPAALTASGESDVDSATALAAWESWADPPSEPASLARHLRDGYPPLRSAVEQLRGAAAERYSHREEQWAPLAARLADWTDLARRGLRDRDTAGALKEAEGALDDVGTELRGERFEPISRQAIDLWRRLKLQSNVDLTSVELTGSRTRRRVDLKVSVDGHEGAALGVVSQGEVNCLALSLFFPRVTRPGSPFRFLAIDDPVQAMDPARVDGLASVFADMAADRQIVVFTHDDRLPEALRRLALPHTILELTRAPGSVVSVRMGLDPVHQAFRDARAVAMDGELPVEVARRVVPGLCRSGIEAACMERVRRVRIGRGESHGEVEDLLLATKKLAGHLSLALFDDPDRGGEVGKELERRWGRRFAGVFRHVNKGAHHAEEGNLIELVNEARSLAERIRTP